jgi:hypothetical protein
MSQAVIVKHLLTVGSSRYQDPKFKEEFPTFSPISRFGIGVLSAFMIADDVEITTCSPDDVEARRISLRSVHGKYLIRLLDKVADRQEIGVYPHGTAVRLRVRESAKLDDVIEIASRWIKFPRCKVILRVNGEEERQIGYASPAHLIEQTLRDMAPTSMGLAKWKVVEREEGGVRLAYGLVQDVLFRDWTFIRLPEEEDEGAAGLRSALCTCVEGIGVEFKTPGFEGAAILAAADASGVDSPKTNVARSSLEETSETGALIDRLYRLYVAHFTDEVERLRSEEGFSTTRALEQVPFLTAPLVGRSSRLLRPRSMEEAMGESPLLNVEEKERRMPMSLTTLGDRGEFWSIESPLLWSIESFIRESASDLTSRMLLELSHGSTLRLPEGRILANFGSSPYMQSLIRGSYEISEVVADVGNRRLDARWKKVEQPARWISSAAIMDRLYQSNLRLWRQLVERLPRYGRSEFSEVIIPLANVTIDGLDGYAAFHSQGAFYLHPEDPVSKFLGELARQEASAEVQRLAVYLGMLHELLQFSWYRAELSGDEIVRMFRRDSFNMGDADSDHSHFVELLQGRRLRAFDPNAWLRRDNDE